MSEGTQDILAILDILPHRYPFVLIDRVLELEVGQRVKAIKNVTYNEHFFMGHFPKYPVMPGVLIIEAMAQTGGVLAHHTSPEDRGKLILFMGMDKVKFRRQVVPGDQLVLEVTHVHRSSRAWKMSAKAFVDDKVVAQAELTAVIGVQIN